MENCRKELRFKIFLGEFLLHREIAKFDVMGNINIDLPSKYEISGSE